MRATTKINIAFLAAGLLLAGTVLTLTTIGVNKIILFVFVPIVSALVGYYASKVLSKPIHELYKRTEVMRSQDLDYRMDMDSKDEMGQLSKAFDSMTKDLKKMTESVDDLNEESADQKSEIIGLQEREDYFRKLFENSNDAVFIYDFEDRILDANKKACDMLNYPKSVLLKRPFLELYAEDELSKSKKAFKSGTDAASFVFESKFVTSEGRPIDVQISSGVVDLKRGIMQAIVQNITARKELERALVESEEKFRSFMETASDLMYITDKDGHFSYTNEAMANSLGYSKEELVGMHMTEVMDEKSAEDYKVKRQQLIAIGEVAYESIWETKTRKKIYGELQAVSIYDGNGNYRGSRGVFRDVTERKKVEESQRLANLGKLAADVAHEVNNPVTVISGNAELALLDGPLPVEAEKAFKIIMDQCEQARSIVKRLLMFSKPSTGEFVETNINDAVDTIVSLVETQFKHSGVKIKKALASKLPRVRIDEKQIQEVFMNLLRNALEAMPKGGNVVIITSAEDSYVKIDIEDTGTGISEEYLKKIFDPFFTTKKNGTGLGLSVCYGILQAHGGDLKYSAKSGRGTTATVLLPVSSK
ncbi:MAG: PAS domain S-box protein [Candidatus Omnitrophota bacterium]